MSFAPRYYQSDAVNATFNYWLNPKNKGRNPILELPTGAGKSLIQAMIAAAMFEHYGQYRPRILVTTPSKELCAQNAEKLLMLLPQNVTIGYYSASLKEKRLDCDVTVATIDSIHKDADYFRNISVWINDECHLGSIDGEGVYWALYQGLLKNNPNIWCAGMTATPYLGSGVWITAGKKPIYHGFSYKLHMNELISHGYLSSLIKPAQDVQTKIDISGVNMRGSDYNLGELSERTALYLESIVNESIMLGHYRKKWIAFLPDINTANDIAKLYNARGIAAAVVHGKTPAKEREKIIDDYKKGFYRVLVTVLALTTGFDVPDIDCIIWARNTVSIVLYSQGAGRGLRIANGKKNCLWLDFTDTTERLGPINELTGRPPKSKSTALAPCIICPKCGTSWIPASTKICADYMRDDATGKYILDQFGNKIMIDGCGAVMREDEDLEGARASNHDVMTTGGAIKTETKDITHITCAVIHKTLEESYLQIDFCYGLVKLVTLNINFENHGAGYASQWWKKIYGNVIPASNQMAYEFLNTKLNCSERRLDIKQITIDKTNRRKPKLIEITR